MTLREAIEEAGSVWPDDLHERIVDEAHERLRWLPPAPTGQRWAFDCEVAGTEGDAVTMAVTARLVPVIRVESE